MRPIETLHKSWVNTSWSLAGIFPPIMLVVQQLGELDIQLRGIDKIIEHYAEKQQDPPGININSHLAQSYLWVLGTYEIARTVAQHSESNPILFSKSDKTKVVELKHHFARLRVPLAKFEPANKHKKNRLLISLARHN